MDPQFSPGFKSYNVNKLNRRGVHHIFSPLPPALPRRNNTPNTPSLPVKAVPLAEGYSEDDGQQRAARNPKEN